MAYVNKKNLQNTRAIITIYESSWRKEIAGYLPVLNVKRTNHMVSLA